LRLDPELNFESSSLIELLAYWNTRRGGRPFPSRKDIVPGEIQKLLPWLHMFDVINLPEEARGELGYANDFRVRLIGTAIAEVAGDLAKRERLISQAKHELFAERTWQGLQCVVDMRQPVRMLSASSAFPGKDYMKSEVCLAPLSSNGADIDIIIGVTSLQVRP
jgi:hypothetical protein